MPRTARIRKRAEFTMLQRIGRRRAGPRFVVIVQPRPGQLSRIGITTSKKVGGAVVRNRVKRLIREFFRRNRQSLSGAQDVLVIARPSAAEVTYTELKRDLSALLRIDVGN